MKKVIIPVAVIAAIGLIAPKFTGGAVNQGLDDLVSTINEAPAYQASIENRQTGWFSSSAEIIIGIDYSKLDMSSADMQVFENFTAKINFSAQHGPFLSLNGLGLGLSAWKAELDESIFREYLAYAEDQRFYSMTGNIGLLGDISYKDKIPAFSVVVDEADVDAKEEMSFSGWNGGGIASASQSTYTGKMDTLVALGNGVTFEMKSVSVDMLIDAQWTDIMTKVFYDSSAQFAIESINFDMPMAETKAVIKNLAIDALTQKSEDDKLMDIDINYAVSSIDMPKFQGSDLIMKTEINNLERGFFQAYQKVSANPAQFEQAMKDIIDNKLLPQLQASPEMNITELSGKVAEGKFSGKILTKLTGINSLPQALEDPAFWISKVLIDSQLKLDKEVALWLAEQVIVTQIQADPSSAQMTEEEILNIAAQQVEGMLNMLTQQGMATMNADGNYEMSFSMKDGQALLNGNPMPLPI